MSEYFIEVSFELYDGQLDNWKKLSQEISKDLSNVDGFISRDSGIDENNRVYCLVKWESRAHQERFRKELESRDNWNEMMNYFGSVVNVQTEKRNSVDIF